MNVWLVVPPHSSLVIQVRIYLAYGEFSNAIRLSQLALDISSASEEMVEAKDLFERAVAAQLKAKRLELEGKAEAEAMWTKAVAGAAGAKLAQLVKHELADSYEALTEVGAEEQKAQALAIEKMTRAQGIGFIVGQEAWREIMEEWMKEETHTESASEEQRPEAMTSCGLSSSHRVSHSLKSAFNKPLLRHLRSLTVPRRLRSTRHTIDFQSNVRPFRFSDPEHTFPSSKPDLCLI